MTAKRRQPARALLLDAGPIGPELRELIGELRGRGVPVGLLGESTMDEAVSLVDVVADVTRLSREYFLAACLALRTVPALVLYVDRDDRAVSAARVAGLSAYRWTGAADLPYLRAALGQP